MHPDDLFNIFGVGFDLYTLFFLIGIVACLIFAIFAMKKTGYSPTARDTVIIIGIISIIMGLLSAILFQAFYDFLANPSKGFKINGGMTFLGGLIGGIITFIGVYFIFVYAINPKLPEGNFFKVDMNKGIWFLVRIAPISITIAHAFGRIGCSFAGCCYGKETTAWYGIWNEQLGYKTVPVQLFESVFLFILTGVLIVLLFKFHSKDTMAVYLVSYGIWRFVIEFFRDDYRGNFIPGVTPSQFWSIIMVIAGIAVFFLYRYFDRIIEYNKKQKELEKKDA